MNAIVSDPAELRALNPREGRMPQDRGWVGFDLDGTLAFHEGWVGPATIGRPIPKMIARLHQHINDGDTCRIFTARCYPLMYIPVSYCVDWIPSTYEETIAKQAVEAIREWSRLNLGFHLEITCVKDYKMWRLYDDRAVQVQPNTGICIEDLIPAVPKSTFNPAT